MTVQSDWAVLTDEQRQFFEDNGYLLIEDALPPDVVAELNAAADEIYDREKAAGGLEKTGKLNLRNCIVHHDAFLQLLDWPTTAPLAWQILNWNIQMITSHLIVLPSGPEPPEEVKRKGGYHRDGGSSSQGNDRTPSAHFAQNCVRHQRPDRSRIGGDATRAREQSAIWQAGD